MARCLVTGGGGFIGSNLVAGLLRQQHQVVVVDTFATGREANLAGMESDVEIVRADIRDRERIAALMKGIELVFHQAALPSVQRSVSDPWASNDANVNGTLSILIGARDAGVRRVVYASSSSAYGDTKVLPKVETMPPMPLSPYAVSKYMGELYCQVFYRVYGLETVALRYFNVFGPRQDPQSPYAAVIPRFITALASGEPPTIYGDGGQTRDFTFIENVVHANILAATAPAANAAGKVFNVGCGDRISLNDLCRAIGEILGRHVEPTYLPVRPGDVRDSQADITQARDCLGYTPAVSLHEGLRRTAAWCTSTGQ